MSTWHQKSFIVTAFIAMLIIARASAATEGPHNLILIIPEALPADGIDRSNAPALAHLRQEGVTFGNSHAGFPRLTPSDSFVDASDLKAESLLAAATDNYTAALVSEGRDPAELQRLVTTTLPQAKARNRPFFIVYQIKEPPGLDNSQGGKDVRPAFKPDPRTVNTVLETIDATLKTLGLYENTNVVVAAEHGFSRVLKTSNTSHARALLPHEDTLGVLSAGFVAIDLIAALQIDDSRLELFDPDAGNSVVNWKGEGHPKLGNGIITANYDPAKPYVTVEAHGSYDSIFLADSMPKNERRAVAHVILENLMAQDYLGGLFVNERRVGLFRGALPLNQIARHGERDGLPDLVVVFKAFSERCAPAEVCTTVVADTPLIEGEGIANAFSRAGTATFMAARGPDFRAGVISHAPASNADLGRTIADLLDLDLDSSDLPNARVLRESFSGDRRHGAPQAAAQTLTSTPAFDGRVTKLQLQTLGNTLYFDAAVAARQEALAADVDRPTSNWHLPHFREFTISISDKND